MSSDTTDSATSATDWRKHQPGKTGAAARQSWRQSWRKTLRQRRRSVTPPDAEQASRIVADLLRHSAFWNAEHVALYLPQDGELDPAHIADAAQQAGKSLYLPVISCRDMHFAPWAPGDRLQHNRFGIGEPLRPAAPARQLDLLLMPLVGWTPSGFRLGMGGGYYDRFLSSDSVAAAHRLGLAYECQREPALDALRESWDVLLHGVLTERQLYRFS